MKGDEEEEEEGDDDSKENREIFVGNIAFITPEDTIKDKFSKYGEIQEFKMPTKNGRPSGVAFILYSTSKEAQKAIKGENNQEVDGRKLGVDLSKNR